VGASLSKPWLAVLLVLFGLLLQVSNASAQALQLRVGREPYYEGIPVDIHVHAAGFEKEPDPTCEVGPPAKGSLVLRGLVPNISSRVEVINGRVSRAENVTYTCQYQFVADGAGSYTIGPFRVSQGGKTSKTERIALRVEKVPIDDRVRVRILVPDEPVFLGQHVEVQIEWWIDDELRDRISSYAIRSRLFEQEDTFRFIDDPPARRGQQNLSITVPDGSLELGASLTQRRVGGSEYLVVASRRTLVPLRSGDFDLGRATVQLEEVVDWQRDLFGRRTASRTRKVLGKDEPRRLVVKAPPLAGRPSSYAGAVGRGFSLDVTAARSVVQLGDPITLELTIRGDGNLESAGLPVLRGPGGLDPKQFRTPSTDVSGRVDDDAKTFRIGVRVLDDSVREIPALDYSWFDPDTMTYKTTQSRPIALSVRPAEVISAGDVVTAVPPPPDDERAPDGEPSAQAPSPTTRRGSIRMTGADLSLVRDEARLLETGSTSSAVRIALYTAGLALLVGALWQRRRSNVSPELLARRQCQKAQRSRVAAAREMGRAEALSEVVAALRELASAAPETRSGAFDAFIRDCEAVLYDPSAGAGARTTAADPDADEAAHSDRIARAEALLDAAAEEIG